VRLTPLPSQNTAASPHTTSSPLRDARVSVVYSSAFSIQFLDLTGRIRFLVHHNNLFVTMCALTQDVYYFRPFQIAELRGFLGSLRHLRRPSRWRVPRWSSSH